MSDMPCKSASAMPAQEQGAVKCCLYTIGVLIVGTIIGLLPPRIGIRRSHGMGIILVPIMIYTFAQKFDSFGFI